MNLEEIKSELSRTSVSDVCVLFTMQEIREMVKTVLDKDEVTSKNKRNLVKEMKERLGV